MADRHPPGTIPANNLLTDLKNVKLILAPTSSNNHGSDLSGLTLPTGQIQFAQINKNVGKVPATTTMSHSLIKTINHPKISTLVRSTAILQSAGIQQSQQQQLTRAKLINPQQNSSPSKIIIQVFDCMDLWGI